MEPLSFPGAQEWREWLAVHHGQQEAVWLVIRKKGATGPGLTYDEALDEALCFGWIDGRARGGDEIKYTVLFAPRRPGSPWSQINRARAIRLIEEGRMTEAGLSKIEEAERNGRWENAYTSRKKLPVPADLADALRANSPAEENFNRFPPSIQSNYVGWVEDAKREETRQRRIKIVVERSEQNKRPGEP